ncbi:ATP-binding protein [Inmirania thermothiophila]|uniref:histidine kinase n=1 Tax=Inmirania thermothiophila TaxID=1750597 RepID=A0A3N1Y1K5_9GAMM|nr:ATP-binding protein [Inmirania thermothiophila]ROR32713.1 PAS domain S-box-containing protein [Inmirania thermothiophila]
MGGGELAWVHELLQLARAAAREERPRLVQHRILEHMVQAFEAETGTLALVGGDGDLEIVAAIDLPERVIGERIPLGCCVLGWVAEHGEPVLLSGDAAADPRFRFDACAKARDARRAASAVCWPLAGEDGVRGVIALNRGAGRAPFTGEDLERGRRLVEILAVVLDNTLFAREARERAAVLERTRADLERNLALARALGEILERAQQAEDVEALFPWAVERLAALPWVGLEPRGAILLGDEEEGGLRLAAHHGLAAETRARWARIARGRCPCGREVDEEGIAFHDGAPGEGPGGGAHHVAPIRFGGRFLGLLHLGAMPEPAPGAGTEEFLGSVANVFASFLARMEATRGARLLQRAVEASPAAVVITDAQGHVRYANPRFGELTGRAGGETTGRRLREVLFPPGAASEEYEAVAARALAGGSWRGELRFERSDGGELWALVTLAPVRGHDGALEHVVVVAEDITERRRAEEALRRVNAEQQALIRRLEEAREQLVRTEKLAAIGQLAAGIAHEINNPVGYVGSNLGTLREYVADLLGLLDRYREAEAQLPEAARRALAQACEEADLDHLREDLASVLDECDEGIGRVRQIVQSLKDFSRVNEGRWELADLHRALDSTLNVVWNELKYKAEVIKAYGEIPQVECILSQLNQVFMNLLVNAAQAIEDRGTIWIRTGAEGPWVWVEVEDTGKGIPPEDLPRIFDPFFTTKPVGKGTGLGLSISYGIVEKHGGRIDVESTVGRGTRFRVWIPVRRPVRGPQGG